jgi:transcriptional regulator with XRE-family HTH domain
VLPFELLIVIERHFYDIIVDLPTIRWHTNRRLLSRSSDLDYPMSMSAASHLAENLQQLRQTHRLTQAKLAALSGVPRATIAMIETGEANPTLSVLSRLSAGLQATLDELVSKPRPLVAVFQRGTLPTRSKAGVEVRGLLPHPLPGLEISRMELQPGANLQGVPHRPGTREYLACERGQVTLRAAGETFVAAAGDVISFLGDQRHSYQNKGSLVAVAYSVVSLS